ncbi:hypothetical protein Q5P01_004428 [Channa striata]|uniref:Uncharacterized protein n=1 Tax=Channa striata TaxID=64152 RepID=A0AA88NMM8_CHASR|nr:hypothetical protein Q5P01_004428 [Channa striata]
MDEVPGLRPLELYKSQLPKQDPFSCVLDMVVQLKGQEHEEEIKRTLTQLVSDLEGHPHHPKLLASSTICVAKTTHSSQRTYGVSVSATPATRRILIAASCLSTLDKYVAGAVMTYHPDKKRME